MFSCETIRSDFITGMGMLTDTLRWQWQTSFVEQYLAPNSPQKLSKLKIAEECDIDYSLFLKFLRREQRISDESFNRMVLGFGQIAHKHNGPPPGDNCFPTRVAIEHSGWLHAVNKRGHEFNNRFGRWPLGIFHYFCLCEIYSSKPFFEIIAGRQVTPEAEQVAAMVFDNAFAKSQEFPAEPVEYCDAMNRYPVRREVGDLKVLVKSWSKPWEMVFECMGGGIHD